jgi:hypothetical protein
MPRALAGLVADLRSFSLTATCVGIVPLPLLVTGSSVRTRARM